MVFKNAPQLADNRGEQKIRRFVHTPLVVEHFGINASIAANGKVTISKVAGTLPDGTVEVDEVEIPASLVFKIANALKLTRKVEYVGLQEALKHQDDGGE
jgi:predicted component of type VI protein secretion system